MVRRVSSLALIRALAWVAASRPAKSAPEIVATAKTPS
jgi:hypothetical protein